MAKTLGPIEQAQHKISETYFKQFSFDHEGVASICLLERGNSQTTIKPIAKFNTEINIFDIENHDPDIKRVFEDFSGDHESAFNLALTQLRNSGVLKDRHASRLMQYAANLFSRCTIGRELNMAVLRSENKNAYIKFLMECTYESEEKRLAAYPEYIKMTPEQLINRVTMLFNIHLSNILNTDFDITIFKAPAGKGWFTSDNPVVISGEVQTFHLLPPESEVYFPISSEWLAYIHNKNSANKSNPLRSYTLHKVHLLEDGELFESVTKNLIENLTEYLVCPMYIDYNSQKS